LVTFIKISRFLDIFWNETAHYWIEAPLVTENALETPLRKPREALANKESYRRKQCLAAKRRLGAKNKPYTA
jgi:hypothetical protein